MFTAIQQELWEGMEKGWRRDGAFNNSRGQWVEPDTNGFFSSPVQKYKASRQKTISIKCQEAIYDAEANASLLYSLRNHSSGKKTSVQQENDITKAVRTDALQLFA